MKKSLLQSLALVVALTGFAGGAQASTWDIDSAHANAAFSVKHLMVSTVRGEFGKVAGTINVDDKDITKSTVEATIDVATLSTHEEKRDQHLKSPDFFDVAKFPTITFKSTKVQKAGAGHLKVTGDLTIHGVTKPVTLAVEGPAKEIKDPWGLTRTGFSATTKVNRKDFGLVWNKTLDGGGIAVGDEVTITLDFEAVKKGDAPAAPAK